MKSYHAVFMILILSLFFFSCKTTNRFAQNPSIVSFKKARIAGNINAMSKSVDKMIQSGIIKNDMTQKDVLRILGKGDHFTGIYVPEGISIGFNKN